MTQPFRKNIQGPTKYGFESGTIRVLEKKLLSKSMIERLVDAKTFKQQLHILSETDYSHLFQKTDNISDIENDFEKALEELYQFLSTITNDKDIIAFFRLKYDYHNLKVFIKETLTHQNSDNLLFNIGNHSIEEIRHLIEEPPAHNVFGNAVSKATEIYNESENPVLIDYVIDNIYFKNLIKIAKKLKSKHLVNLVKKQIDLANIKTVIRDPEFPENYLIGGGTIKREEIANKEMLYSIVVSSDYKKLTVFMEKEADLSDLDIAIDDIILESNKEIEFDIAGVDIIVSYFIKREFEIKTLRMLIISKYRNVTQERKVLSIYG